MGGMGGGMGGQGGAGMGLRPGGMGFASGGGAGGMGFGSGGGGMASPRVPGSPVLDGLRVGRSGRPPPMNGRPSSSPDPKPQWADIV